MKEPITCKKRLALVSNILLNDFAQTELPGEGRDRKIQKKLLRILSYRSPA